MADAVIQKLDQSSAATDSDETRGIASNQPEISQKTAIHLKCLSKEALLTLKQHVLERLARVENLTLGFLFLLIILVTLFSILFSRGLTKKIEAIAQAARKLSDGDFEAKTGLISHDEFGEIGKIVDSIGPRLKDHYRMLQSISVAVEIQQRLFPGSAPSSSGYDIHATAIYSDETGGDYFDYLCSGANQKLCLVVGDVADHGLPAALLMASIRGMLRLRAAMPGTLEEIVADVNRQYVRDVESEGRFMTLFLARVNLEDHLMEWVRAGHDPAIIYDAAKDSFTDIKGRGTVLGISPDTVFVRQSISIHSGQVLCMFTDGIPETRNAQGIHFGRERLCQAIRRHAAETARRMVLSILEDVSEFRGAQKQEDDLTIMIVKFLS